ncbi:hypothetical protein [uncultured Paraglaciecola sp.]|uniref:hypothetical protein n=1 Tax=uncultured Paraglaciecola sp. TaxID=1765024 RepID=UPI0026275D88|nr:hypothetical protein [uncultured Paraglaciecola sp.]
MTDRVHCIVPGCGRSYPRRDGDAADGEILCATHWRNSPSHYRYAIKKWRRLYSGQMRRKPDNRSERAIRLYGKRFWQNWDRLRAFWVKPAQSDMDRQLDDMGLR